jgi:hypothetical protein
MSSKAAVHVLAFEQSFPIMAGHTLLYRGLGGLWRRQEVFCLRMYTMRCQIDIKGVKTSPADICIKSIGAL